MPEDRASRMYPARPLVGVGAVIWDGARVLLEQRGQPPAQGTWALPGGLIELGETAEEAVRREVREETGLEVEVGPVLGLFEPLQREADGRVLYHFVVIDFLAYYVAGEPHPGDDAADVRWVTPEELAGYENSPAGLEMITRGLGLVATGGARPAAR
jgi:8-oxo-dGTP diphosphatase